MCKISIVIATLGGSELLDTIKLLNQGTLIPDEILICVPNTNINIENLDYPNTRIILTEIKGQVAQRLEGFKQVKNDFVLQIDDDISVDNNFLKKIYQIFKDLPENSSLAPSFKFLGSSLHVYPLSKGLLSKFYYFLINGCSGYQQGIITKASSEIGVNYLAVSKSIAEAEWLPGGCILHRKKNLVLFNYFPFEGKAFCEDLFHSCELKKKGINLFVTGIVHVKIADPRNDVLNFRNQLLNLKNDFKIRSKFCEIYSRKKGINFFVYYFLRFISIAIKSLF
jgi:glycosyltransferase involved in cell wall biosynthesis